MNVSEPLAVKNDAGIRISGEFQPRILDPLIIQLDDENIADIKSEGEKSETAESEKRDSRRSEKNSSDHGDLRRETIVGDVDVSVDENKLEMVIPPVWTSANKEGNALLMYFFFAKVFFKNIHDDAWKVNEQLDYI